VAHIHEFVARVKNGVAGGWPAESCLGDVPERRARRLLAARQEETITPHGEIDWITSWREVNSNHEDCWLAGNGFVI
jgi:hypothetical protein